jgi:hypothetical protein
VRREKKKQKATVVSVFYFLGMQSRFLVLFCYGSVETNKKKRTTFVTFFDGFAARKWQPAPFFSGFATKKVMVVMSSPSSMVVAM